MTLKGRLDTFNEEEAKLYSKLIMEKQFLIDENRKLLENKLMNMFFLRITTQALIDHMHEFKWKRARVLALLCDQN